jgi:hypothetical protein
MYTVATEHSFGETGAIGVTRFRSQLMHHTITMVAGHNSHFEVAAYPQYLTGRHILCNLYFAIQFATEIAVPT